jgi:hypothetical protein
MESNSTCSVKMKASSSAGAVSEHNTKGMPQLLWKTLIRVTR